MKKYKINTLVLRSFCFLLIITFIAIVVSKIVGNNSDNKSYTSKIIINSVDKQDRERRFEILVEESGNQAIVSLDFLSSPIYITEDELFYLSNGRYKSVASQYSYRDIFKILNEDIEKDDEHPLIKKEVINKILECLFINFEVDRDIYSNVVRRDKRIESFSVYMNDVYNFKKFDLIISFDDLDNNSKVKIPVIHEELLDNVDSSDLQILKQYEK